MIPETEPDYIRNYYPPIYKDSECKEVKAIIKLNNYIIDKLTKKIEKRLQEWTLTKGIDEIYAQKVVKQIETIYVSNSFPLMMSKKTPISTKTLKKNIATYFHLDMESLDVATDQNTLYISYDSNHNSEKYTLFENYIPFLKSYIPLCIPPYFNIEIRNLFLYKIENLNEKIDNYNTLTVEELTKYIGD